MRKQISASPTVRTFKTFVIYLESHEKQIHHFDQHISLWGFELEAKIKIILKMI